MTPPVPLEADEGRTLVAYLRIRGYKFTHIPNETGRSPEARRRAIRMKQQGTSSGFIDYVIIVSTRVIGIELKRVRGSKTSPEQLAWVKSLNEAGLETRICKGAAESIAFIKEIELSCSTTN